MSFRYYKSGCKPAELKRHQVAHMRWKACAREHLVLVGKGTLGASEAKEHLVLLGAANLLSPNIYAMVASVTILLALHLSNG